MPETYECFNEIQQLFLKMLDYGNVTCTRIKLISAYIHLMIADKGGYPGFQLTS